MRTGVLSALSVFPFTILPVEKYGIYAVFEEYPVLTYFMGFYPADAVSPTVSQ